jgi:hypothetical protein
VVDSLRVGSQAALQAVDSLRLVDSQVAPLVVDSLRVDFQAALQAVDSQAAHPAVDSLREDSQAVHLGARGMVVTVKV